MFDKAFALQENWLTRHPSDLNAQLEFAETHLTTLRFPEAVQRITDLLNKASSPQEDDPNQQLAPTSHAAMLVLLSASHIGLGDEAAQTQTLDDLISLVQAPARGVPPDVGLERNTSLHRPRRPSCDHQRTQMALAADHGG